MIKTIGIGLAAGLTSALLVAALQTAPAVALPILFVAPLPVMIAGLGFTQRAGLVAALSGTALLGGVLGPVAALCFAIALGVPCLYLVRVALLSRPIEGDEAQRDWFPVASLVLRIAGTATVIVLVASVATVVEFGGYHHAVAGLSARFAIEYGSDDLPGGITFADLIKLVPFTAAALTTLLLALNLWLAARVVQISGLLPRPWPTLPDMLRLPRAAVPAFVLFAALASFAPDAVGAVARIPAAALGMAFVFEGLAAAHVLTRGLVARRALLAAVYLTVLALMPWPPFALAVLGVIDCLAPLRGSGMTIIKRRRS